MSKMGPRVHDYNCSVHGPGQPAQSYYDRNLDLKYYCRRCQKDRAAEKAKAAAKPTFSELEAALQPILQRLLAIEELLLKR